MLPSDKVIIEILETVEPTEEVVERCKQLKQLGFILALDDFIFDEKYSSLIEISDISKIKLLKQAMALLGEQETKKWLYLITIQTMANDKPDIILKNSLIRAKFSEFVALGIGMNDMAYSAYLTGMLSMIDTLLDRPLNEILSAKYIPAIIRMGIK